MRQIENTGSVFLREGERIDDLHRNGYRIIQNGKLFCFGMDAVLLSGFAVIRAGEKCADLGCGTGILPILLEAKTDGSCFYGIEISSVSADMAQRSVDLNSLGEKIKIIHGDLKDALRLFPQDSFDVVTSNPPYMTGSHGLLNQNPEKAAARHEIYCTFEDVARSAAGLLRTGGKFFLVHRPFRLAEIIRTLSAFHLEPKRMRLVYPFVDKEPNMVLIEAVKGGRPRMTLDPPLIVYESPGVYTKEVLKIYGYEPSELRRADPRLQS